MKTIYLRSRDIETATVELEDDNGVRWVAGFWRANASQPFTGYPVTLARKSATGWTFGSDQLAADDLRHLTEIGLELANR